MKDRFSKYTILTLVVILILALMTVFVIAQESTEEPEATADAQAMPEATKSSDMGYDEDLVAYGEYLISISRCVSCHTPALEEFDTEELSIEQRVTLSLNAATRSIPKNSS